MAASRSVAITGASTGIGLACVQRFVKKGWRVFAGVRKSADAERLSADFGSAVTPLVMEVTDPALMAQAAEDAAAALAGARLTGLVANAGVAVPGPLLHLPPEELNRQLDINVTGVLRTVQAFAPLLGAAPGADKALKPGRIVMMSSVAGFSATPFLGAYAASKHGVEALTQGLRRELTLYGVDVVAINPGPIRTPIWDKIDEDEAKRYAETDFAGPLARLQAYMLKRGREGLPPSAVAKAVMRALTAKRPPVNQIVTPGRLEYAIFSAMPARMSDNILAKRLGLTEEDRA